MVLGGGWLIEVGFLNILVVSGNSGCKKRQRVVGCMCDLGSVVRDGFFSFTLCTHRV